MGNSCACLDKPNEIPMMKKQSSNLFKFLIHIIDNDTIVSTMLNTDITPMNSFILPASPPS